jgi:hypothetical protein
MKKRISKLDIFGSKIELNCDTNSSHKTLLGGIVTIIITIFAILGLYVYGFDVVAQENPEIIIS